MNLCDDGHYEICYEGRQCPACVKKEELQEAQDKIKELERQLEQARESQ